MQQNVMLEAAASVSCHEVGGSRFLRNVVLYFVIQHAIWLHITDTGT
jgi:hypothetical protein